MLYEWLTAIDSPRVDRVPGLAESPTLWERIDSRAADDEIAVVELHDSTAGRLTFRELHDDVTRIGAGLAAHGVQPGDRVALMIPPGLDLTATLYACWRIGAAVVGKQLVNLCGGIACATGEDQQ